MSTDFSKIIKAKERSIDKEYQERLTRCRPVAQKILEMIAAEQLPIGDIMDKGGLKEDVIGKYEDLAAKVLVLMLESNLRYSERNFLFQLVLQPYEQAKEKILNSVNRSFTTANEQKWGKDELDITMGDIHEILIGMGK
jgi:hypothetical protein